MDDFDFFHSDTDDLKRDFDALAPLPSLLHTHDHGQSVSLGSGSEGFSPTYGHPNQGMSLDSFDALNPAPLPPLETFPSFTPSPSPLPLARHNSTELPTPLTEATSSLYSSNNSNYTLLPSALQNNFALPPSPSATAFHPMANFDLQPSQKTGPSPSHSPVPSPPGINVDDRTGSIHVMKQQRNSLTMNVNLSPRSHGLPNSATSPLSQSLLQAASLAGLTAAGPMSAANRMQQQQHQSSLNVSSPRSPTAQQQQQQNSSPQSLSMFTRQPINPLGHAQHAHSPFNYNVNHAQHPLPHSHSHSQVSPPPYFGPVTDHAYSPLNASQHAMPRTQPASRGLSSMMGASNTGMRGRQAVKLENSATHMSMAIPPTITVQQHQQQTNRTGGHEQQQQQQQQQYSHQHRHLNYSSLSPFSAPAGLMHAHHQHSMSQPHSLHALDSPYHYYSTPTSPHMHHQHQQQAMGASGFLPGLLQFSMGRDVKGRGLTSSASTPSLPSLQFPASSLPSAKPKPRGRTRGVKSSQSESTKKKHRLARKAELARASRKRKKAHLSELEKEVTRLTARIAEVEARKAAAQFEQQQPDASHGHHHEMLGLQRLRIDDQQHALHQPASMKMEEDRMHSEPPPSIAQSSHSGNVLRPAPAALVHSYSLTALPRVSSDSNLSQTSSHSSIDTLLTDQHNAAGFTATRGDMYGSIEYLFARIRRAVEPGMQEKFAVFAMDQAPKHLVNPAEPHENDAAAIAAASLALPPSALTPTGLFWHSFLRGELGLEDAQFEPLKRHRDAALTVAAQMEDIEQQVSAAHGQIGRFMDNMLTVKSALRQVLSDGDLARLYAWLNKNDWVAHMLNSQMNLHKIEQPLQPQTQSALVTVAAHAYGAQNSLPSASMALTQIDDDEEEEEEEDDDDDDSD